MKIFKNIAIALLVLLACPNVWGQTPIPASRVPDEIKQDFALRFHEAERVNWRKQGNDFYGAHFKIKDAPAEVIYDAQGSWQQSIEEIEFVGLPDSARHYLTAQYSSYRARKVAQISSRRYGILYEIHIAGQQEELQMTFDMNGAWMETKALDSEETAQANPSEGGFRGKFGRLMKK